MLGLGSQKRCTFQRRIVPVIINVQFVVASYLLSIDTASELEEYLGELLDVTVPANKNFVRELLERWQQQNGKLREPSVSCGKVCLQLQRSCVDSMLKCYVIGI